MISTFVIVYREALEIALILGVLLAATGGLVGRTRWILMGFFIGAAGSVLIAGFAGSISAAFEGAGQEVLNALVLFSAALLIAWTLVWMVRHGRTLTKHFKEVGASVSEGKKPVHLLALVVALAVLREGSEIVLFLYGVLASGESSGSVVTGGLFGLAGGAVTGLALYWGLLRISPKHLFGVTSWLLVFVAAGMVSQALGYLVAGGVVPEIVPWVYDLSGVLPESGIAGKILHAVFGYSQKPSGIQCLGYLASVAGIIFMMKKGVKNVPGS